MDSSWHPIIFSGPMIRALLAGRKTQTRRAVKPQLNPSPGAGWDGISYFGAPDRWCLSRSLPGGAKVRAAETTDYPYLRCPYGRPGDRLWVREAHCILLGLDQSPWPDLPHRVVRPVGGHPEVCHYREGCNRIVRWRPSIHMPRWASRISLLVNSIRVERLQAITEADAAAEGMTSGRDGYGWYNGIDAVRHNAPSHAYAKLWDQLHRSGDGIWGENPWVWVVSFQVEEPCQNTGV